MERKIYQKDGGLGSGDGCKTEYTKNPLSCTLKKGVFLWYMTCLSEAFKKKKREGDCKLKRQVGGRVYFKEVR